MPQSRIPTVRRLTNCNGRSIPMRGRSGTLLDEAIRTHRPATGRTVRPRRPPGEDAAQAVQSTGGADTGELRLCLSAGDRAFTHRHARHLVPGRATAKLCWFGPPRVGKTHLLVRLGIDPCGRTGLLGAVFSLRRTDDRAEGRRRLAPSAIGAVHDVSRRLRRCRYAASWTAPARGAHFRSRPGRGNGLFSRISECPVDTSHIAPDL
jgi:hypothetical protein